jgi:hypothetical protein
MPNAALRYLGTGVMSQLPGRPDSDQLRCHARELHRGARNGDTGALR